MNMNKNCKHYVILYKKEVDLNLLYLLCEFQFHEAVKTSLPHFSTIY